MCHSEDIHCGENGQKVWCEMSKYQLYWNDGKLEVVEGATLSRAMTAAGYGAGALRALCFWGECDHAEYEWNPTDRSWNRIVV